MEKVQFPTSFHPNQARIKFSTRQCVKEVLCDIAPTNSCHLLFRWVWFHFKMLNLYERSLYLRHEWHEMKFKFMTPWNEGKTHVEGENRKRRNINSRRKGNWRKRKGSKEKDDGKGSRETRCLIEGHPCLVAFIYESGNNVVSQRLVEKLKLPMIKDWSLPRMMAHGTCLEEREFLDPFLCFYFL